MFDSDVTPAALLDALESVGDTSHLRVEIDSDGGSVFAGIQIYDALRRHPAYVDVYIGSRAVSIASVIAMAGDRVTMGPSAQMMIHDPWGATIGNAEDHLVTKQALDVAKESIISAYKTRAKVSRGELAAMLSKETWLTAMDAVHYGLADRVDEPGNRNQSRNLARAMHAMVGGRYA